MRRNTLKDKLTAAGIILIITAGIICIPADTFAAKTSKVTKWWRDGSSCSMFKVEGANGWGICSYDNRVPAGAGVEGTLERVTDKKIIKLAYYTMFRKDDLTDKHTVYLHVIMSYWVNGKSSVSSRRKSMIPAAQKWAETYTKKDMPPDYYDFKVYYWSPSEKVKYKGRMVVPQTAVVFDYKNPSYVTLKKQSEDPEALSTGEYSLKEIEYTVYKSDKKTEVGKLIVKNNKGESNKIKTAPGTYYARETKVPSGSGFKKSTKWLSVKAKSGKTAVFKAEDPIETAYAYVEKKMADGSDVTESFKFKLTNTKNNKISKTIVTKPGSPGKSAKVELPFGTYKVKEELTKSQKEKGFTAASVKTIKLTSKHTKNDPYKITAINRLPDFTKLEIHKSNLGGESGEGFSFSITGKLYGKKDETYKQMTAEEAVSRAAPEISGYDKDKYEPGEWTADQNDIEILNNAAQSGTTGEYEITLCNTLKNKAADSQNDDIELTAVLRVDLKEMIRKFGDANCGEYKKEADPVRISVNISDTITISYNKSFEFAGALTPFDEIVRTTDEDGFIEIENVPYGIYTVTEIMTDEQKKRYHDEEGISFIFEGEEHYTVLSQTRELGHSGSEADWVFEFVNIDRVTPVKLHKVTDKGDVGNLTFRLTGKTIFDEEVEKMDLITDQDGFLEIGELRPGDYILEETDFDSESYFNAYKIDGYENPAIGFTVTGEENGTLWIGGEEGEGRAAVGNSEEPALDWVNPARRNLLITKTDGETGMFLPGAVFEIKDDEGRCAAKFEIIENEEGESDIRMISAEEGITGGVYTEIDEQESEDGSAEEPDSGSDNESGNEHETDDDPESDTAAEEPEDDETDPDVTILDQDEDEESDPDVEIMDDEDDDEILEEYDEEDSDSEENADSEDSEEETDLDHVTNDTQEPGDTEDVMDASLDENESGDAEESGEEAVIKYAVIKGLRQGKEYRLFEVKAPEGYSPHEVIPFTMEDMMAINVENHRPEIETIVKDEDTGEQFSPAGKTTIIDTVSYKNLTPGMEYTLSGSLMYAGEDFVSADKSAVKSNGQPVKAETVFTPEKSDGETEVVFSFDGSDKGGSSVVVFEELYLDGERVAFHNDPDNEYQTFSIPEIRTAAALSGSTIKDTVICSNLMKGFSYMACGWLVDKKTGTKIAGSDGCTMFRLKKDSDVNSINITVDMKIDQEKMKGKELTAFEELYLVKDGQNIKVAEHKDPEDDAQTVSVPQIETRIGKRKGAYVIDNVIYSNLTPGRQYVIRGRFVDKSTGKTVSGSDGTLRFTPKSSDGYVKVKLKHCDKKTELVAFEKLYQLTVDEEGETAEVLAAKHEDINSREQTYYEKNPPVKTGDNSSLLLYAGVFFISAAIFSLAAAYEKSKKNKR